MLIRSNTNMKMLVLWVLFSAFSGCTSFQVPVLAWTTNTSCGNNTSNSSLKQVKASEFGNVLMDIIKEKCMIIIFVEDFLAVEDFISSSDPVNGTFPYIQEIAERNKFLYFPRVYKPLDSLKTVSVNYSVHERNISENIDYKECIEESLPEIRNDTMNVEIIYMGNNSDNKSRTTLLEEHDKMMTDICSCVEKYKKVICVLTGLRGFQEETVQERSLIANYLENQIYNPNKKKYGSNIEEVTEEIEPDNFICEENCSFTAFEKEAFVSVFLSESPILYYGKDSILIDELEPSVKIIDNSSINLKIASHGASLLFNFTTQSPETWELTDVAVELNETIIPLQSDMEMKAPTGHSVICKRAAFFGGGIHIDIPHLQIEPVFLRAPTAEQNKIKNQKKLQCGVNQTFGPAEICIPFFSSAVFMAYIITCALLLVLAWGFGMIQALGSNDSFDGPKQKILLRD